MPQTLDGGLRGVYSPDLDPIELAFAKLKALLRKAAKPPVDDLWARISDLLDCSTPDECRNYFKHAGHASNLYH